MMNKLISYFGTFTPGADGAVGAFQFEYLTSLGFAALVIFAGRAIVRRSHVLRKFAIPAPVISGLLFSVLIAIFKGTGILAISFDTNVSQRSAIGLLDKRQAEVIRLVFVDGIPTKEVAASFGLTYRTIDRIKRTAIENLAEMYAYSDQFRV